MSIQTPASIDIRVIEVRNPPPHEKVTAHGVKHLEEGDWVI